MALYKNDVIFELSRFPKEIEAIEEYFHGKFPVKVTYPPERIIPSRLKHNRRPDKPNSISFDFKAIVKTSTGSEVWRYAEQVLIDNKGQKKYVPKKFLFNGTRFLERNDIELIYFLLRKSEYCFGGDNYKPGTMAKFVFEDKISEAEKKAERKKVAQKVNKYLYDEDYALSDEKIVAIAKAYNIVGADDFKPTQLRLMIESLAFATPSSPKQFFDMISDDAEIEARSSITRLMDLKLLIYDESKKTWLWEGAGEDDKRTVICKVPPSKTPNETIYDHYKGNNTFREDIKAALITSNPKSGSKKKETVDAGKE